MANMVKAILFDMGGTLVYESGEKELRRKALVRALRGLKSDVEELIDKAFEEWDVLSKEIDYVEQWDVARVSLLLARLGIKPKPLIVEEAYRALTQSSVEGWEFEEDARETLLSLKDRGFSLGVISNTGSREQVVRLLIKGEVIELLDVVVTSQELGVKKPHPLIFKYAEALLGIDGKKIAYVGNDPIADIEGAKNVGWIAVQKLNRDSTRSSKADIVIRKLSDLLSYFK
ncbi:MAG TPA: HAD family hydrolase [Thermofilum sp.]|nr:HAD family hydrolase [Thermofilum sp.]